uniref:Putative secreted protein n=1 Tax=Anopheles marajoara TaxID=58244 RepID=A0A2M4CBS2_9DIPT
MIFRRCCCCCWLSCYFFDTHTHTHTHCLSFELILGGLLGRPMFVTHARQRCHEVARLKMFFNGAPSPTPPAPQKTLFNDDRT